jgi:integrase
VAKLAEFAWISELPEIAGSPRQRDRAAAIRDGVVRKHWGNRVPPGVREALDRLTDAEWWTRNQAGDDHPVAIDRALAAELPAHDRGEMVAHDSNVTAHDGPCTEQLAYAARRQQAFDLTAAHGDAARPRPQVWTPALTGRWQQDGWRRAVGVWTAAQTSQFLAQVRGHRLYALFHLVALRGLRRGEAAGLRWSDLDLDAGTLTVSGQLQQLGGRLVAGPPKSDAGRRVIALDNTTITAPREHRTRQQAERAAAGTRRAETGYAFTTVTGTPFRPDRMTRQFAKLVAASGLPPVTLHGLRHGAATIALAAGADLKVVQDQLGHSTITLTADTYTSVLPETARTAGQL